MESSDTLTRREKSNHSSPSPHAESFHSAKSFHTRSFLYQWRPFRGMICDVRNRLPFYITDWTEGFQPKNLYRVIAATIRIYFLNLMPAIAYTLDMNARTGGAYGINETILSSAIAGLVFAVLSCQPITIVGVTGLINLFNYTVYDIIKNSGIDYLQFQAWILIWSGITHFLVSIFNVSDYTRFITDMTCETFGFYVGVIYIQKGIELLVLEFTDVGAGWLNVVITILFTLFVYYLEKVGTNGFGPFWLRKAFTDYSFAAVIIFMTGFVHIPGNIRNAGIEFLEVTPTFQPSTNRPWLILFWQLPIKWVFIALPFGCLVTLLFYFDNNVSALMAQSTRFPIKRPAGFHFDFFLLGITTFISGILGLPAPNGLVPQNPTYSESLCILEIVEDSNQGTAKVVTTRIVEQRVSHFLMGLLILGTMSSPLLTVLGLMPRAMFSGIFIIVGWGSIETNPIVVKTLHLIRDRRFIPQDDPLRSLKNSTIARYVSIQWAFFAATIAVSETIAGIAFPLVIIFLIPLRVYLVPNWFTEEEIEILDSNTADTDACLVSLGGPLRSQSDRGGVSKADVESISSKIEMGLRKRNVGNEAEGDGRLGES